VKGTSRNRYVALVFHGMGKSLPSKPLYCSGWFSKEIRNQTDPNPVGFGRPQIRRH
jgi:hypothetical protein